jgi:hypothetical protein
MVNATVEILVFVGMLKLWFLVFAINVVAILVSLTRMLWLGCLLILALHFVWSRSRWVGAVPVIPCICFVLAPGAVRNRVTESIHPEYYSNAERVQMFASGVENDTREPVDRSWSGLGQ